MSVLIPDIFGLLDILLVALLLYYVYKVMREFGSINVFYGILVLVLIKFVAGQFLKMRLINSIFNALAQAGMFAFIVLFKDEIRRFFLTIGSRHGKGALLTRLFSKEKVSSQDACINSIVSACTNMSKEKVGALIIIERNTPLNDLTKDGIAIDAITSQQLIENMFVKNTPLHDGAMVISDSRIKSACCFVRSSMNPNIPKHYGSRHRAALGVAETTDAIVVIVSEETGYISIAHKAMLMPNLTPQELEDYLRGAEANESGAEETKQTEQQGTDKGEQDQTPLYPPVP